MNIRLSRAQAVKYVGAAHVSTIRGAERKGLRTETRATASSFAFHWVENVFHAERWNRRLFGAISKA